ncbi:MAG TPA: twin-arginine translocase subunit TatC [Patescibacteria group bacterium]|nr:twin-arginine translocase subunit TatC [Patescibacteria group bacterium]
MPEERDGQEEQLGRMSFLDHLEELRSTLIASIVAFVGAGIVIWFFSGRVLDFLLAGIPVRSLYFTAPIEAFMTRMKLSFALGFLVSFPYILFRGWSFVSPGLFRKEKKLVVPLIVSSTFLFYLGAVFAYWVLIPVVLDFLLRFGTEMLEPLISVGKYFGFVTRLCFAFGLVFQLPLVIVSLTAMGVISARALLRQWRWAILLIFIAGAVLTPPDPASQLLMALPLVFLFLLSSALSVIIERRIKKRE